MWQMSATCSRVVASQSNSPTKRLFGEARPRVSASSPAALLSLCWPSVLPISSPPPLISVGLLPDDDELIPTSACFCVDSVQWWVLKISRALRIVGSSTYWNSVRPSDFYCPFLVFLSLLLVPPGSNNVLLSSAKQRRYSDVAGECSLTITSENEKTGTLSSAKLNLKSSNLPSKCRIVFQGELVLLRLQLHLKSVSSYAFSLLLVNQINPLIPPPKSAVTGKFVEFCLQYVFLNRRGGGKRLPYHM